MGYGCYKAQPGVKIIEIPEYNKNLPYQYARLEISIRLYCNGKCNRCEHYNTSSFMCDEMQKSIDEYKKYHISAPEELVRNITWRFLCEEHGFKIEGVYDYKRDKLSQLENELFG